MEFRRIFSDGTVTQQPRIVIDGFSFPSELNNDGFSIFANGLFGSGSLGVPSTRAQLPTVEPRPTGTKKWKSNQNANQIEMLYSLMLCKTSVWSLMIALSSTIDSRKRTPGPIVAPGPIDTFGPSCKRSIQSEWESNEYRKKQMSIYRCRRMNGCRWINVNIADDIAYRRLLLLLVRFGASIHFEEMTIRIDGRTGRFNLWPPIVHRQRERFAGAGQFRQHFTFPFDVTLVPIVSVAVRSVGRIARARMKDLRNSLENIQRTDIDAAVDERRHIGTWFFHIMIDSTRLRVDDQTTIMNCLLFRRLRTHYRYLRAQHLGETISKVKDKIVKSCLNKPQPLHFSNDETHTILSKGNRSTRHHLARKMPSDCRPESDHGNDTCHQPFRALWTLANI